MPSRGDDQPPPPNTSPTPPRGWQPSQQVSFHPPYPTHSPLPCSSYWTSYILLAGHKVLYPPDTPSTSKLHQFVIFCTPPPATLVLQTTDTVNLKPFSSSHCIICPQSLSSSRPPGSSPREASFSLPPASVHQGSIYRLWKSIRKSPNCQNQMPRLSLPTGWPSSPASESLTVQSHGGLPHPLNAPRPNTRTYSLLDLPRPDASTPSYIQPTLIPNIRSPCAPHPGANSRILHPQNSPAQKTKLSTPSS